jgi:transcriptional regulator with XRE-family HTH domain
VIDLVQKITNVKTLKERLVYARELRGLTQGELADKAKCAQSAIGNAESGERKSLRNLVLVARVLQISADWLFDGRGPKPTKIPDTENSFLAAHVVPIYANEPSRTADLQTYDPHTLAAVEIMLKLHPNQREGALAALRTHVGYLAPPRIGQAL